MKKLILLLLVLLFNHCIRAQVADDEKIILDLETQKGSAITLHNDAFLNNLIDESFRGVTAIGSVIHKAEQLEIYKTNNPYVIFSTEELHVSVNNNMAVVTGKLVSKSKSGSVIGQSRFLILYTRRNNQWKITFGQETGVIKE